MAKAHLADFGRIDQSRAPAAFIDFLDAAAAEVTFQAYKRQMNELLALAPGQRVLDVGCGTGGDALEMARLVGGRGQVVAVDNSQFMVAEAERRAAGSNLPVSFQVADALHLPFPDSSFDACRADRSLMHVPDAGQAIREMARVARPGGHVAVYEVDFETLVVDADDRALTRKVCNFWCDSFRNGWLGRHVPALFKARGLREVTVTLHALRLTPPLALPLIGPGTVEKAVEKGALTHHEGEAWLAHLDELQRTDRFFSTLTGYLVVGRK
jgi:ubiquinone/menaquinone biosynthesis C-methylase UbiE